MPYACGIAAVAPMPKLQQANDITGAQRVGQRTARLLRRIAMILATLVIICVAAWTSVALWFQASGGTGLKALFIVVWVAFSCAAVVGLHRGHAPLALLGFAIAFGVVLIWWHTLVPSNVRLWADDVAQQTSGVVHGDMATLSNVRNFEWRGESDYTARWETRSYDLATLQSLDLITSYWGSPAIAHLLISFGFTDGEHVVFSVEIRREKGEAFSEIGGFFKEFELSVIAADERDVIRVRTNIRGEDDYLYHIRLPREDIRSLFAAYLEQANGLVEKPRFYNTITANCTTLVFQMMRRIVGKLPLNYRLLLSGYLPEYVYAVGGLDPRYTLEQLRAFGRITERAKQADRSPQFSQEIRRGIPPLELPSEAPH